MHCARCARQWVTPNDISGPSEGMPTSLPVKSRLWFLLNDDACYVVTCHSAIGARRQTGTRSGVTCGRLHGDVCLIQQPGWRRLRWHLHRRFCLSWACEKQKQSAAEAKSHWRWNVDTFQYFYREMTHIDASGLSSLHDDEHSRSWS